VAVAASLGLAFAALTPLAAASAADLTVAGTVALDGVPIGAVEVGWYDPASRESGETVSAADGSYSLTIADTHSYVLYAGINRDVGEWKTVGKDAYVGVFVGAGSKQDYLFQGLPLITGVPASGAIDLDKPGSITGSTPGVKSISFYTGGHDLVKVVKPDVTTGIYSVTGLIPGTYFAEADPADDKQDRYYSPAITVAAGVATAFVPDFSVRSTGTVNGVVKSGGKPVKGVSVSVNNSINGGNDTTDSRGRYSISHLPAAKYDVYFAFPKEGDQPGTYRSEVTTATVTAAKKTTVNKSLEKGGTVTGSVVRPGKASYFRVLVIDSKDRLVGGASFPFSTKKASTSFTLKGVKKGNNRTVVVATSDSKLYNSKKIDVDSSVAAGSFTLSKKTLTIHGTVKGAKKGVVSYGYGKSGGAFVGYLASGSATIKNGKYTVKGVLPGLAVLTTVVEDRKPTTVKVHVKKSMKKTLKVGVAYKDPSLTGTFLVDGRPLPRAEISLGKDNSDYGNGGTISVVNGVGTGSAQPNKTWILHVDTTSDIKEFQWGSPFYLSYPVEKNRIKLAPNTTTDLGTVNLVISGR
jgi:hypothetical protein